MSANGRFAIVITCVVAILWGGTTIAAWTSGYTLGTAALFSAATIAASLAFAALLIAAVFWAAGGRR